MPRLIYSSPFLNYLFVVEIEILWYIIITLIPLFTKKFGQVQSLS